jgi:serine/threonine-protein kinase
MSHRDEKARWETLDRLFSRALDVTPGERAAFVEREAGGDAELVEAVRRLLHAAEKTAGFLDAPFGVAAGLDLDSLHQVVTGDPTDESMDRTGEVLGAFRIVERLARGGMATVYVAERADGEWDQRVAVKILRRGLDTDDIVRRFEQERRILSSLEHPHIARLLDGGATADGLPYLVMDLVRGQPITEYCDTLTLPVRRRLELFCKVARAVQYAHTNLVVHRDLKPSNILVDERGEPRLLDFGIAKVLAAEADAAQLTRTGRHLLTPQYASPEQLRGEAVTTIADVYQLGVLLCVLLTGRRPTASDSAGAVADESLSSREPIRPSRLVSAESARARNATRESLERTLRGDLDTIVLEAIRERPDQRYVSVDAMVADIERYLSGRPITARPTTWAYRTGKLIRRRPWLSVAVAAAILELGGYAITGRLHARELEAERNLAVAAAERAEQVRDFVVGVFRGSDPYTPADPERGSEITVREAMEVGLERIRTDLDGQPALQAALLGVVGEVYLNLGISAVTLHQEALELERTTFGDDSPEVAHRLRKLGEALLVIDRPDTAITVLADGLARARAALGPRDTAIVRTLQELGRAALGMGRHEAAERWLVASVDEANALDSVPAALLAWSHHLLGEAYPFLSDPDRALENAERALELGRAAHGEQHANTGVYTLGYANAMHMAGRTEASIPVYRQGIAILEQTLGPDHTSVLSARNNLALRLADVGDLAGADAILRDLLRLRVEQRGEEAAETGRALQNLAAIVERQERFVEADSLLERAHAAFVASLPAGHYLTAFPLLTRSGIQLQLGDHAAAARTARQVTGILEAALPEGHYATAVARCRWGRALAEIGREREGRELLTVAADAMAEAPSTPPAYEAECLRALVDMIEADTDEADLEGYRIRLEALADSVHG